MKSRVFVTTLLAVSTLVVIAGCSPPATTTATTAKTDTTAPASAVATAPAAATASAVPALFAGIAGVDRVPATLLAQMAADTAPHWTRCGDEMVTQVMSAAGQPEGIIVARALSFQFVDAAIGVPARQAGVTSSTGINLRSNTHQQHFTAGIGRTDASGRRVVEPGWGEEIRVTAPLPFWTATETNGAWTAAFRPNSTDAAAWTQRYRAVDCGAVPPKA